MTNAEAIENLKYLRENFTREGGTMCQAVDMAVAALKAESISTNADCDAEYCEYNEDGMCHANPLEMDGNGVCISIKTVVRDEDENGGAENG